MNKRKNKLSKHKNKWTKKGGKTSWKRIIIKKEKWSRFSILKKMEMRGIDPRAPRMQSECSTIWATSPSYTKISNNKNIPLTETKHDWKWNKNNRIEIKSIMLIKNEN